MPTLVAEIDVSKVKRDLLALGRKDARAAVRRGLTRASSGTRTQANRAARKTLNVSAGALSGKTGRTITVRKDGSFGRTVVIKGQGLPLSEFRGTRQLDSRRASGLSVKVYKSSSRKVLKRGRFLHPITGTSIERDRPGGVPVGRTPTSVLFGPGVAQVLAKRDELRALTSYAERRFLEVVQQEIRFRLARR